MALSAPSPPGTPPHARPPRTTPWTTTTPRAPLLTCRPSTSAPPARTSPARSRQQSSTTPTTTPTLPPLRADLHERLDHPDFAWDVAERPIETIIADLCLNLGISDIADLRAWAARTAELSPIAASPAQPTEAPPQTAPPWAPLTPTSTGPPAP